MLSKKDFFAKRIRCLPYGRWERGYDNCFHQNLLDENDQGDGLDPEGLSEFKENQDYNRLRQRQGTTTRMESIPKNRVFKIRFSKSISEILPEKRSPR